LEGIDEMVELTGYLTALGIPEENYEVDFSMVRGLEYYTGPIYETMVDEPRIGSITGGGRYDNLIEMFLPEGLPATGTTLGIERIIDVMDELDMFPAHIGETVSQVLVTLFDEETTPASLGIAQTVRQAGINTELYFEPISLGKQIRHADKKGIPFVVIAGPDELAEDKVTIRRMFRSKQATVDQEEMIDTINRWLAELEDGE
jgi:histidyl-tRNA synthetase